MNIRIRHEDDAWCVVLATPVGEDILSRHATDVAACRAALREYLRIPGSRLDIHPRQRIGWVIVGSLDGESEHVAACWDPYIYPRVTEAEQNSVVCSEFYCSRSACDRELARRRDYERRHGRLHEHVVGSREWYDEGV